MQEATIIANALNIAVSVYFCDAAHDAHNSRIKWRNYSITSIRLLLYRRTFLVIYIYIIREKKVVSGFLAVLAHVVQFWILQIENFIYWYIYRGRQKLDLLLLILHTNFSIKQHQFFVCFPPNLFQTDENRIVFIIMLHRANM